MVQAAAYIPSTPQAIYARVSHHCGLFNQMMVEGIADQFGGGREL